MGPQEGKIVSLIVGAAPADLRVKAMRAGRNVVDLLQAGIPVPSDLIRGLFTNHTCQPQIVGDQIPGTPEWASPRSSTSATRRRPPQESLAQ